MNPKYRTYKRFQIFHPNIFLREFFKAESLAWKGSYLLKIVKSLPFLIISSSLIAYFIRSLEEWGRPSGNSSIIIPTIDVPRALLLDISSAAQNKPFEEVAIYIAIPLFIIILFVRAKSSEEKGFAFSLIALLSFVFIVIDVWTNGFVDSIRFSLKGSVVGVVFFLADRGYSYTSTRSGRRDLTIKGCLSASIYFSLLGAYVLLVGRGIFTAWEAVSK